MRGFRSLLVALAATASPVAAHAAPVIDVDIYSGFTASGGGQPFSNLVGSFTTSSIAFGASTGFAWQPFGQVAYGALFSGSFVVPAAGDYTFTLTSDDGSQLYIDGVLAIDNGNDHGPQAVNATLTLATGLASFELFFYENGVGPGGVDLVIPSTLTVTPLPAAAGLLGLAVSTLTVAARRRTRS